MVRQRFNEEERAVRRKQAQKRWREKKTKKKIDNSVSACSENVDVMFLL